MYVQLLNQVSYFPSNCLCYFCTKSINEYIGLFLGSSWLFTWSVWLSFHLPYCLSNYSCKVHFKIRHYETSTLFFFFRVVLAILSPLYFHLHFRLTCKFLQAFFSASSVKINWGRIETLPIMNFPTHEYYIPLNVFRSCLTQNILGTEWERWVWMPLSCFQFWKEGIVSFTIKYDTQCAVFIVSFYQAEDNFLEWLTEKFKYKINKLINWTLPKLKNSAFWKKIKISQYRQKYFYKVNKKFAMLPRIYKEIP